MLVRRVFLRCENQFSLFIKIIIMMIINLHEDVMMHDRVWYTKTEA